MSSFKLKPSDRESIDFAEQEKIKRKDVAAENFAVFDEKGHLKDSGISKGNAALLNKSNNFTQEPQISGLTIRRYLGINKTADWDDGVQETPVTISAGAASASKQAGNYGTVVAAMNTTQTENAHVEIQMSSDNSYFKRVAYFKQIGFSPISCVSYFIPPGWWWKVVCSSQTGAIVYYSKLNGGAFPSNA